MQNLEESIEKIESRNKKVETDKAWRESMTRKLSIVGFILYILIAIYISQKFPTYSKHQMNDNYVANRIMGVILMGIGVFYYKGIMVEIEIWWKNKIYKKRTHS